jgi:hypothetical protein
MLPLFFYVDFVVDCLHHFAKVGLNLLVHFCEFKLFFAEILRKVIHEWK